jgi:hypothetical protein
MIVNTPCHLPYPLPSNALTYNEFHSIGPATILKEQKSNIPKYDERTWLDAHSEAEILSLALSCSLSLSLCVCVCVCVCVSDISL